MSKYSKAEQTEIVQLAMELEATITNEQQELTHLAQMKFRKKPLAPEEKAQKPLKKVEPKYPEAPQLEYSMEEFLMDPEYASSSAVKFARFTQKVKHPFLIYLGIALCMMLLGFTLDGGWAVLGGVGGVMIFPGWLIVGYLISSREDAVKKEYKKVCEHKQAELEQSPEYLAARAEAEHVADEENRRREEEYRLQQEENRREYTQSMEQYNNVTLVAYRSELEHWQEVQAQKAELLKADIAENRLTQETLYSEAQLIPKTVRSLEDLTYLYEDMSSSEHDIERAIDMLNAYKQRKVTREEAEKTRQKMDAKMDELRGNMQQGFAQVYGLIDEGNYRTELLTAQLASKMNDIRSGIRRGNIAAIVQRYGTNKRLREISNNIKWEHPKFCVNP